MWNLSLCKLIALCIVLFCTTPSLASDLAGVWALRAEGTTLMVFEVDRTSQGWSGSWSQPGDYRTDGDVFTQVKGQPSRRKAREVRPVSGGIELVFDSPFPGGMPDRLVIRPRDAATAKMSWAAYGATRYLLTRVSPTPTLGPWQADRGYVPDTDRLTDPEMTVIYAADQAARADLAKIDWNRVRADDATRRVRTRALLDAGRLASADDFYHAAFVFQHGDTSADYLKAHALAVIAAARGRSDATWIAAATLDRYLQSIGQPQIYGTQFRNPGAGFTQEPYSRDLLSDALRRATQVPTLAAQDQQRQDWDRRLKPAKATN